MRDGTPPHYKPQTTKIMTVDFRAETTEKGLTNDYDEMRAAIEKNIAEHDRHVQMIPRFNEDGTVQAHNKTGNTMMDFAYTVGNYETHGTPEIITFYPGAKSAHFALNCVSRMMAAEYCPIPTEVGQLLTIENMFEGPAKVYVYKANACMMHQLSNEYTCQCDDNAEVLVMLMEYPNGQMDRCAPGFLSPEPETFGTFDAKIGNQG